jgi:hypothetical protein
MRLFRQKSSASYTAMSGKVVMQHALPAWIGQLEPDAQEKARCRYLLRLAALHYSSAGHLAVLSKACGLAAGSLAQLDQVSATLAIRLEAALGRDAFPRQLFRPDLFESGSASSDVTE